MSVAVLGLGIIGRAWATNLISDGLEVRCWNRTPRDFPGSFRTPAEAVSGAEFVILVVADPAAVRSVLDGIQFALRPGQVLIQCSTISASYTRRFAAQVIATGASFLEAPFTGSKPAAEHRKTVFYTGGDEEVLQKARPLLERLSSEILHIGPLGSASSLKLAMNVNIAGVTHALCESLALCRAENIADEIFFQALHLNASRSGLSDLKEPKLLESDFSPQFSVKHLLKDLRLALSTALSAGLPLPHVEDLIKMYETASEYGWEDEDFSILVRLLQNGHSNAGTSREDLPS